MGTRRKSRELVLQMLFQADMGKQAPGPCPADILGGTQQREEEVRGFANDLFRVASDRMPGRLTALSESTPSTGVWTVWLPWIGMCFAALWRSSWLFRRPLMPS